jgi:FkbM family methyltransferase
LNAMRLVAEVWLRRHSALLPEIAKGDCAMTATTGSTIAPTQAIKRRLRRLKRRWRRRWERYVKWPAPLWRLRGYARLQLQGYEFTFYIENVTISWARKVWRGKWERNATGFLKQVLRPGDVFFDVGAWAGPFSLLAARLVEPGGWVYAFEPDPIARGLLERHVAANRVSNITILPYGVTDEAGPAWLASSRLGDSQSWVDRDQGIVEIQTVTLAGYCEQHGIHPDVIKIDVEGAEAKVVAGATEVLRGTRAIVIELHDPKLRAFGVDPATFRQSLDGLGKQITLLHDRPDAGVVVLGLLSPARLDAETVL